MRYTGTPQSRNSYETLLVAFANLNINKYLFLTLPICLNFAIWKFNVYHKAFIYLFRQLVTEEYTIAKTNTNLVAATITYNSQC